MFDTAAFKAILEKFGSISHQAVSLKISEGGTKD